MYNTGNTGNRFWNFLFFVDGIDLSNGDNREDSGENIKIIFDDIRI